MTPPHDFKNWHRRQIDAYSKKEFPSYELYANVLEVVLKHVCSEYAKLGIVQSRAKAVSSFAEKVVRKWPSVDKPIEQLTDLCGARVITLTQGEMEPISGFIETHFDIVEAEDVGTRLGATEFGYTSFHYVVRLRPEVLNGVALPKTLGTAKAILRKIGDRKAEIQVRTLLQHAWADVMHDRLYKTRVKTPDTWKHLAARQAAILETADNELSSVVKKLDSYLTDYSAYMTPDQMKEEIEALETVLENEPVEANKPAIQFRIAKMAKAKGDWKIVIRHLRPLVKKMRKPKGAFERAALVELGRAFCQVHKPGTRAYLRGRAYLERVTGPNLSERGDPSIRKLRAEALALLAESYAGEPGEDAEVRRLCSEANVCDPDNPYHLIAAVEQEVVWAHNLHPVRLAKSGLAEAIATCTAHAALGIELPRAFYAIAKANLLLERYYEAAKAYARGARFSAGADEIERERKSVQLLRSKLDKEAPIELVWIRRFLSLIRIGKLWNLAEAASEKVGSLESAAGKARRAVDDLLHDKLASDEQTKEAREELMKAKAALAGAREAVEVATAEARSTSVDKSITALSSGSLDEVELPVVLVAGSTDPSQQARIESYREALQRAFKGFRGTVISGGTVAGISGLVGELAKHEGEAAAVGYLPKRLPTGVSLDKRYAQVHRTLGVTFSPLEPLQYWIDLLASGVKPPDICLLGIGGGSISSFEYNLALAMGAIVGVMESSGGAASEIASDRKWWPPGRLLVLPDDVPALRAFVNQPETDLNDEQVDAAARVAHEVYAREQGRQQTNAALQPWEYLRRDFQESNRQQVIHATTILEQIGYRTGPLGPGAKLRFKKKEIDAMAELEHGRWIVERLRAGWTYGEEKNADNKVSPYLVPWNKVSEHVKDYDRKAVMGYPRTLREAGLGVFPKEPK